MTSTKVEDRVTAAVLGAIGHALALTASMTWEILWALILGFALSAVVQAVVRRSTIVTLLGDDRPRTLVIATGLGAASSSRMPRWLWLGHYSAKGPTSLPLWRSRSVPPTSWWSWASSWPC